MYTSLEISFSLLSYDTITMMEGSRMTEQGQFVLSGMAHWHLFKANEAVWHTLKTIMNPMQQPSTYFEKLGFCRCHLYVIGHAWYIYIYIYIYIYMYIFLKVPLGGSVFSKKATLRGIGDVRGKLPFRLNELSFNFRRKLLISSLV